MKKSHYLLICKMHSVLIDTKKQAEKYNNKNYTSYNTKSLAV